MSKEVIQIQNHDRFKFLIRESIRQAIELHENFGDRTIDKKILTVPKQYRTDTELILTTHKSLRILREYIDTVCKYFIMKAPKGFAGPSPEFFRYAEEFLADTKELAEKKTENLVPVE